MTSRLVVIPLILMTTAAIADNQRAPISGRSDAQAQAAALLSPQTSSALQGDERRHSPSVASPAMDAHASAAALLSGARAAGTRSVSAAIGQPSGARINGDAQAQAAALLHGSQSSTDSQLQTQWTKRDDAHAGR
jgi:hypothetical protein